MRTSHKIALIFICMTCGRLLAKEKLLDPTGSTGRWVKVARIQNSNPINGGECSSFSGTINVQTDYGGSGTEQYYAIFSFGSRPSIKPLLQEFGNAANRNITDASRIEWRVYSDVEGWHYLWFWQSNYSRYAAFDYQNACGLEYWTIENPPSDYVEVWSSIDGDRQYSDSTFNSIYLLENLGIGTSNPGNYKLAVNGDIHAKEVKVDLIGWPDYVFTDDYELISIEELKKHILEKGYLPEMPSAKNVEENGVNLGEMDKLLLKKIEELTLYIIQLKEENSKIQPLQEKLKSQEKRIEEVESILLRN